MKIHIPSIVSFFDNSINKQNSKYSNTMVSLLGEEFSSYCFKKYYEDKGATVDTYNIPCKKNGRKGKQLDRWISCKYNNRIILYQTEIKTWNSNGISGRPISLDTDINNLSRYANEEWNNIWNIESMKFKSESIDKVLLKMDPQKVFADYDTQQALLIYWLPVFNKKIDDLSKCISFKVKTNDREMDSVEIFSVSIYLRYLSKVKNIEYLDIPISEFPILDNTMEKIRTIIQE